MPPSSQPSPAAIVLERGQAPTPALVGQTLISRPTRDAGTPLVLGGIYGVLAVGLAVALCLTIFALGVGVLAIFQAVFVAGFAHLATALLADALAARRFNKRRIEVRIEVRQVVIRDAGGESTIDLTDALEHPLVRDLPVHDGVRRLLRARAACLRLPPGDDVRVVLETLALLNPDGPESDEHAAPVRPLFVGLFGGRAIVMSAQEDVDDLLAEQAPVYRVATAQDVAGCHAPRLTPDAVRRVQPFKPT